MDSDQGAVAALGTAFGAVLYAGAEVVRRIRNNGPKNDPAIIKMQTQMVALQEGQAAAMKVATAVAAQLDGFVSGYHEAEKLTEKRLNGLERNGKK